MADQHPGQSCHQEGNSVGICDRGTEITSQINSTHLAICVCVYPSCCFTNSWENKNHQHLLFNLLHRPISQVLGEGEHAGLGKRNAALIPKLSSFTHCEISSVNFRRPKRNCDK